MPSLYKSLTFIDQSPNANGLCQVDVDMNAEPNCGDDCKTIQSRDMERCSMA